MTASLVLVCLLQQLAVAPFPVEVGGEVVVTARLRDGLRPGLEITAVLPDGTAVPAGVTDVAGSVRFVPKVAGEHRFVAVVEGARWIAPLAVLPARRRWPYAIACVPLGLAFLLSNWRRRPAARESRVPPGEPQRGPGERPD